MAVNLWRVVEAVVCRAPSASILNNSVPALLVSCKNLPVKDAVDEALIKVPVVEVALTWNKADLAREAVVVAPTTKDFIGEEVAERKSPTTDNSRFWPKSAPPLPDASSPSQRATAPVIERQKSDHSLPVTPLKEKLVVARLVELAVVEKREVVVALVVVELPVMVRLASMVEDAVEIKPLRKPRVVEVETP